MKKTRTPSEPLRKRQRQDGAFRASRPSFCSPNLQFHPLPSRRPHQHFTSFLSTLCCLFPSWVRHLSSQALFTPRVRLPLEASAALRCSFIQFSFLHVTSFVFFFLLLTLYPFCATLGITRLSTVKVSRFRKSPAFPVHFSLFQAQTMRH